ncbi:MAG: DUF2164 domain-containing protein [Myxococcota bacterium]|nr:DUF2164 domain-containing protein [Myxococcota bacterium]
MRIRLEDEPRARVLRSLRRFLDAEFEIELSEFQAERVLDFLVVELGAPVYNQAIRDARGFLQDKLDDLDVEFYEPEE